MVNPHAALLEEVGQSKDSAINLIKTALALSAHEEPDANLKPYENHVVKMADEVTLRHAHLLKEGAEDDAATQLAALKHVMIDIYDYQGNLEEYDDLQNADMRCVIDRKKGLPVALSILYIHLGLAQGWQIEALNFPAHVVCRIEKGSQRLLFDPFHGCQILQASDLRALLKTLIRSDAELSASYYTASTRRALLIRLQNNLKLRLVEQERYDKAITVIENMRRIDPGEYRLLFDQGVLYARINQGLAAIRTLEQYADRAPQAERGEALMIINQIKENIN